MEIRNNRNMPDEINQSYSLVKKNFSVACEGFQQQLDELSNSFTTNSFSRQGDILVSGINDFFSSLKQNTEAMLGDANKNDEGIRRISKNTELLMDASDILCNLNAITQQNSGGFSAETTEQILSGIEQIEKLEKQIELNGLYRTKSSAQSFAYR